MRFANASVTARLRSDFTRRLNYPVTPIRSAARMKSRSSCTVRSITLAVDPRSFS